MYRWMLYGRFQRWNFICIFCGYLRPDCLCAISANFASKVSNDNDSDDSVIRGGCRGLLIL